jgi:hypothetical protein
MRYSPNSTNQEPGKMSNARMFPIALAATWKPVRSALLGGSLAASVLAAPVHAQSSLTPAVFQSSPVLSDDWSKRSPEIHWPSGHTPADADLFAHNELSVKASCAVVWQRIVEASKWPAWYPNSKDVRILESSSGTLERDSSFSWSTFGIQVESRVDEFVPSSRIGWFGEAKGLDAYHTWFLIPASNGCHVVTEEVVKGPAAIALRNSDPAGMHKGHDVWLSTLKRISEE